MRRSSSILLALVLGCGLTAAAAAEPAEAPVRLLAPRAGQALAAGSTVEIEWAPATALSLRLGPTAVPSIEEWEAFLSVDGGATYAFRITPHLDQDLRRFTWTVPSLPSRDARILLRFGDERREMAYELPQRFTIVASPGPLAMLGALQITGVAGFAPVRLALGRGEPALPGRPGVSSWVEGSRRGGSVRRVVAAEPPSAGSGVTFEDAAGQPVALAPEPPPSGPPA